MRFAQGDSPDGDVPDKTPVWLAAHSIKRKLFLWFLLQALLVIVAVTVIVAWSFDRGFLQYIAATNEQRTQELANQLAAIHSETGSWNVLVNDRRQWVNLIMRVTGHDVDGDLAEKLYDALPARSFPPDLPAPLPLRFALLDSEQNLLLGPSPNGPGRVLFPIVDGGPRIGYVAVNPGPSYRNVYDVKFYQQFSAGILAAAFGAVVLALLLALGLSRRFLEPIGAIATAARQLASGNYEVRIAASSRDELGRLSGDINALALALGHHEHLTRQWIADISHELRTPVALLRARVEAVQDGVRQLDRRTVDALHADVMRLSLTIEDLYTLSMSDSGALEYRLQLVDLGAIASESVQAMADTFAVNQLSVEVSIDSESPTRVLGDPDRLHQVMVNLLTNSARYTEQGGKVRVQVSHGRNFLRLLVDDSPPAVIARDLPHLFDRLYRTDESRSRRTGGAGLGLAIAKTIVEAHRGSITARASVLGGLQIEVVIPRAEDGIEATN